MVLFKQKLFVPSKTKSFFKVFFHELISETIDITV